jgi:hypothetical protein
MEKNNKEKSTEDPREILVEKLIMEELLNAEDFIVLLERVQEEFKRTFSYIDKKDKTTKERY